MYILKLLKYKIWEKEKGNEFVLVKEYVFDSERNLNPDYSISHDCIFVFLNIYVYIYFIEI